MSITVIVKPGFYRHWNTSMDKHPIWIGSKKQYDRELDERGLQTYDPDYEPTPKRKEYIVKNETRHLVNSIMNQSDSKGHLNPSGTLMKELIKRKVVRKRSEIDKITKEVPVTKQGGFY